MKRIILIIGLLFSLSQIIEAQDKVFFIRIGSSQFTGLLGGEIQVGHFSLEGGYAYIPLPQLNEPWNMAGVGLSYYTGNPFDNSFYATIGYSFNGVAKMTRLSDNSYIAEYGNSIPLIVGYKWGGTAWFSLKGGLGYQFSSIGNSFTVDLTIGIALLAF